MSLAVRSGSGAVPLAFIYFSCFNINVVCFASGTWLTGNGLNLRQVSRIVEEWGVAVQCETKS